MRGVVCHVFNAVWARMRHWWLNIDWNRVIALAAVLGMFVSILTLFAIRGQLEDSKKSRRPWVSADQAVVESDSPDKKDDHYEFAATIVFKNTGLSLATQSHAFIYASAGTQDDLKRVTNSVCAMVPEDKPTSIEPYLSGFVLAPGQTRNFYDPHVESQDITLENLKNHIFWIHGCVKYRDEFNQRHHTRFCFVGRYAGPQISGEDKSLGTCGGGEEAD